MLVVFDINILVSALISDGKPKQLWLKAVRREFDLVMSKSIVDDFVQVIARSKFQRYVDEKDVLDFVESLRSTANFVKTKSKFKIIKLDPDDDIILATAHDGKADYIVSGDRHLIDKKEFRGILIVTADMMLEILERKQDSHSS